MIKKLKINRFKLFESLEVDNFSRVTVLGGKNNVGKTSLLEAIFTFYDRANPEVTLRQLSWRGVNIVALTPEAMWAPIFKDFEMSMPIDIEVHEAKKRERLRIRLNSKYQKRLQVRKPAVRGGPIQIKTEQYAAPTVALDFIYSVAGKEKGLTHIIMDQGQLDMHIDKTFPSKGAVMYPTGIPINPNEDAERFGKIDVVGRLDELKDIIKIIEPRLKSLSSITQAGLSIIHGDIGLPKKIPIPYMGEGVSKLMAYLLAILTTENGIVLIDEIENGMHYSVLPEVWKAICGAAKRSNCQVVITTHSYEAIEAMQETLQDEKKPILSYIRLDRVDNEIVPQYYDPDMLLAAFERKWEVR